MDCTETDMVAHHVRALYGGGMGMKPSDYETIPLTAFQHAKLHSMIEKDYYKLFEIDVEQVIRGLLERYLDSKGIEYTDESDLEILANAS